MSAKYSRLEVSPRTEEDLSYRYFIELTNKYNNKTIDQNERFDLSLCEVKFNTNSYYR